MTDNQLEEEDNLPLMWLIIHSPLVGCLGQNLGYFEEHKYSASFMAFSVTCVISHSILRPMLGYTNYQ